MKHKTICCPDGRGGGCVMPHALWHGKPTGYNNHGCGCGPCTTAWATYMREGGGAPARLRYRAKLIAAGKVTSSGLDGPDRQVRYIPRGRKS